MRERLALEVKYDENTVLQAASCSVEDPKFEKYRSLLRELIQKHAERVQPVGYIALHVKERRMDCAVSLGSDMDAMIRTKFETHEYLEGMLLNAFADQVLFEATNQLYQAAEAMAKKANLYLGIRQEPGHSHIPLDEQFEIYTRLSEQFSWGLSITEGFMLNPSKSLAYYYRCSDEACSHGIDHDCSGCLIGCENRKFLLTVQTGQEEKVIQAKKGENLLEVLRRNQVMIDAPCGGKKLCGKCKIWAKGHGYVHSADELAFLRENYVVEETILACFHEVDRDLHLIIPDSDKGHKIESSFRPFKVKQAKYSDGDQRTSGNPIGIAVDIGTTTLVVAAIDLITQELVDLERELNPQKAYGADVISRIHYVSQHSDHLLGIEIRKTIQQMTDKLLLRNQIDQSRLLDMVIAGNTTMIYLLLDYDPAPLSVAPFQTRDSSIRKFPAKTLFQLGASLQVTILPWISAYVGGDIVSGIFASHMLDQEETILFIDVGTNGEIALKTEGRLLSAATAAGPALEGANIQCGVGAVNGAICEIAVGNDGFETVTLGHEKAIGICGSAIIDLIAILLEQGVIEKTGFMAGPATVDDGIILFPSDVRQIQLAKGAIAAGVETLLAEAGLDIGDVDQIYMAGGFGSHLNINNSGKIGLIPKSAIEKVTVVGNTSLAGCVRYLLEQEASDEIERILAESEYVELSMNPKFNALYIEKMMFE